MSGRRSRQTTTRGTTGARGTTGRSESVPGVPRPREISQVSAPADDRSLQPRSPRGRQQEGFRRPPARDNVQSPRRNVQSPRGNVQSPRGKVQSPRGAARPREASVYSDVQEPPPILPSPRGRGGRSRPAMGAQSRPQMMRPREISEVSEYADVTGPPPGLARGRGRGRDQPVQPSQFPPGTRPREMSRDRLDTYGQPIGRPREISQTSIYGSPSPRSRGAWRGHVPSHHFWERSYPSEGVAMSDKPERTQKFRIPGLSISTFLIILFWLPRFFIPWVTTWHQFSIYILSNPSHLQNREKDLFHAKIYVIVGKSIISLASSAFVDCIRKKCDQKYCIYLVFLTLFTISPLAGGFATVALRGRFLEEEEYYNRYWFSSLVLMEGVMSFSFIMFPVQMACIYAQNNKMSRTAHYLLISLFVGLEFFNAYIAFVAIPGPCPTTHGTQLVVWNIIGVLLVMVLGLTVFSFCTLDVMKGVMMCRKEDSDVQEVSSNPFLNASADLTKKKLAWFVLLALPVIFAYFSFATLERFVPHDDWNDHPSSALSMLFCGKIIGVILMALVMYLVRRSSKSKLAPLKAEMFYLGIPHLLYVLALMMLAGRLASLSYPKEGDVIHGQIPDKHKTVFIFINSMFRNRTVCVSSKYFKSFKIRPYQLVARDVYDEVQSLDMIIEVDPLSSPVVKTSVYVDDISKGEWKIFDLALLYINPQDLDGTEYHNKLYAYALQGVGSLRPQEGSSQLMIFEVNPLTRPELWYYQLNHSSLGSIQVPIPRDNSAWRVRGFDRTAKIWKVPASGKWTVQLWCKEYSKSEKAYAWATNSIQRVHPLEFELGNHSLYLLMEYFYEESIQFAFNWSFFDNPPSERFQGFPLSWKLYKLAEVAGPKSNYIPTNDLLQNDWAIRISMVVSGSAAGGIFVGFLYMFWVDPPVPRYRTITLAVVWVLMGIAAGIPRVVLIKVDVMVSVALLILQIVITASHFVGSVFMFVPALDFHQGP